MDELVYTSLCHYFNALEKTGYMPFKDMEKLLLLCFYRDFVFNDYRGIISKNDYHLIEMALNCLYGSTCLIPYPDYLKMGKLYIGEVTELAERIRIIEDTEVLKPIHELQSIEGSLQSDVLVVAEEDV